MRILVVSHNVFGLTNNMGKTLMSYFSGIESTEIAQLYIHDDLPEVQGVCCRYYKFTDKDAMKSIFLPNVKGNDYTDGDIRKAERAFPSNDAVAVRARRFAARNSSAYVLIRNTVWKMGRWYNGKLKQWIHNFAPEVIFFAGSNFAFMYDIVARLAEELNIPVVVVCVDDYFLFNRNENDVLGRIMHKAFMRSVSRLMKRTHSILTICDTMADAYGELFHKPCHTLHTSVETKQVDQQKKASGISYIGNLGFDRYRQLLDLGAALALVMPEKKIDIYSAETDSTVIEQLKHAPGICYRGFINANQVLKVMENSMLIIHTEAFDEEIQKQVRFSVSTKIPESLMYGPCLLAYGPKGIASIDYLQKHRAAYVITSKDQLASGLREILDNESLRREIHANARILAYENHRTEVNSANVKRWLEAAVADKEQ